MRDQLLRFKKTYITLVELEHIVGEQQTYEAFAQTVLQLVDEHYLQPVKSAGQTPQMPRLHYKYKLLKH